MSAHSEALPVFVKISAVSVGAPLVMLGLALVTSDFMSILRTHSVFGMAHFGLALGPVFAVVGLSFLWPLCPQAHAR